MERTTPPSPGLRVKNIRQSCPVQCASGAFVVSLRIVITSPGIGPGPGHHARRGKARVSSPGAGGLIRGYFPATASRALSASSTTSIPFPFHVPMIDPSAYRTAVHGAPNGLR